jgi:hypothetical protein
MLLGVGIEQSILEVNEQRRYSVVTDASLRSNTGFDTEDEFHSVLVSVVEVDLAADSYLFTPAG